MSQFLWDEAKRVLEPRNSSPAQGAGDLISKLKEKAQQWFSLRRLRQKDCLEFKTCLDLKVSLRPVWTYRVC